MVQREIVFDTETTGLNPLEGDRIVEIGCLELINHVPTGASFHHYINPEREMSEAAYAVHGLSGAFLADKPVFAAIADAFLAFIGDARLVAHNAAFDVAFLDAELRRLGHEALDKARIVDTLQLARRKFPFSPNNLDALCQRFGIDNSRRTRHGALLDAEILAEVYIELLGGRQAGLDLAMEAQRGRPGRPRAVTRPLVRPSPLPQRLSAAECAAHADFVATLGETAIWRDYLDPPTSEAGS